MATTPKKSPLPGSVDYGKAGRTTKPQRMTNKVSTTLSQVTPDFQNGAVGAKVSTRNYPGMTNRSA